MKKSHDFSRNSSPDSIGEDLSFDDSEVPKENLTRHIEDCYSTHHDLKIKKDAYATKKSSINRKKKQFEDDKLFSTWTSVYYTFFNNNINNNITLNEFDLRCKYCFKCDELEKIAKRSSSAARKNEIRINNLQSHANVKCFLEKYSSRRKDNILKKMFKRKRPNRNLSKTTIHNKSIFKTPVPKNTLNNLFTHSIDKYKDKDKLDFFTLRDNKGFVSVLHKEIKKHKVSPNSSKENSRVEKDQKRNKEKESTIKINKRATTPISNRNGGTPRIQSAKSTIERHSNLFAVYDINDAPTLVKSLNLNSSKERRKSITKEMKSKPQTDAENVNYIMGNKHSFVVELDRYSTILKRKKSQIGINSLKDYEHFIDYREPELFFEMLGNKNTSLLEKYGAEMPRLDAMSRKVEAFCMNIVEKMDGAKKIEI